MSIAADLWVWPLTRGAAPAECASLLSTQERARAARFLRPGDGDRFTHARGRMRQILATYCGRPADRLDLATTARGKPVLRDGPAFNLSHAGGYAALVVAPDHGDRDLPLGIDIEAHREIAPEVARLSFADTERAVLEGLSGADWTEAFFRGWTRKEAVLKALGTGLNTPLTDIAVTLRATAPVRLTRVGRDMPPVADWHILHLQILPDLPGAVAAVTGGAALTLTLREKPESALAGFCF